jgi:RND superfamily putative drug exporter
VNEAVELSQFALNIVIGLGLGLSIDYSLFVVSRYREERVEAASDGEALRRAVQVAGRTILYSAVTVAVALATLITFPQGFLYSMGIGGVVTSLTAVTIALVALPALLALLGPRVNSLAPARWRRAAERTARREEEGPWYRLSRAVMRRPVIYAVTSALVLILMALPALRIEFTGITIQSAPSDLSARQVDDALREDFDVNLAEITVLATAPRSEAERVRRFAQDLQELPGASEAATEPPRPLRGGLWEISITPAGDTLDDRSKELVERIREGPNPFPVSVTGQTAHFLDQKESISSHLPLALALLCGLTVIVLFLMTGSVILPLKSLVMNALSLGAAFGLLVLIFQDGRLEGLLGFESEGALEMSQPVLLFALAFGLSTDYAVILLSRIKEARGPGVSETEAVAVGLERTGRIVTQAAILFCIAIGAFATSSVIFIKEVGVGTALAVLIDASIVRAFLVPSLMALLGSRNWWAPGWLRRVHRRIGLSEG